MQYYSAYINPQNEEKLAPYLALLRAADLEYEQGADYILGLYSTEEQELLAGASVHGRTLRGLVSQEALRGSGLMASLISELRQSEAQRGNFHLFLYGKMEYAKVYANLGFYQLATAGERMIFMENSPTAFQDYLAYLQTAKREFLAKQNLELGPEARISAIVMNANPFTLGHLSLVERALEESDLLCLFLLAEDVSEFSYAARRKMLEQALQKYERVLILSSGEYIISRASFPAYFLKTLDEKARLQAEIDAKIFTQISRSLQIQERFLGSEPHSDLTLAYNQVLSEVLCEAGLRVKIIPRKAGEHGMPISASCVRALLAAGEEEAALALLPAVNHELALAAWQDYLDKSC